MHRARFLRRLVRRPPACGAAEALRRVGGVVVARPVMEGLQAAIAPGSVAGEAVLVAIAAEIAVRRSGAVVRLLAADGAVLEHVWCVPRMAPYNIAVFGAAGAVSHLVVEPGEGEAALLAIDAVTFDAPALDPARLCPQVRVTQTALWPVDDPYWEPDMENVAARLRNHVFARLAAPVAVPWLHDLRVMLQPGDQQSCCLMKSGLYEPEGLFVAARILKPGGVFVDAGANCGLYTLFAARAVGQGGQVIAFEPSAREFARLRENVTLNGFNRVSLFNSAVSDRAGTVQLRVAEAGHAGHNTMAGQFALDEVGTQEIVDVASVTLDSVLAGLARLDLIKLDIEGAELLALRGAEATLARLRPAVLIEINAGALRAAGTSAAEVRGWLEARGYGLLDIDGRTGATSAAAAFAGDVNRNFLAVGV